MKQYTLLVLVALIIVLACTVPFKDRERDIDKAISYEMMDSEGKVYAVTSDKRLASTAYDYSLVGK